MANQIGALCLKGGSYRGNVTSRRIPSWHCDLMADSAVAYHGNLTKWQILLWNYG